MENNGIVFSVKAGMGSISHYTGSEREREKGNAGSIYNELYSNIMYCFYSVVKSDILQSMATIKVGWLLFYILGVPTAFVAWFGDALFQPHMEEPFRTIFSIFGTIFIGITCLRAIEKYQLEKERRRKEKLQNDETEFNFNNKRNNHNKH